MFAEDTGLKQIVEEVKLSLTQSFDAVKSYMETFREIHAFYHDNEEVTKDSVKQQLTGMRARINHSLLKTNKSTV